MNSEDNASQMRQFSHRRFHVLRKKTAIGKSTLLVMGLFAMLLRAETITDIEYARVGEISLMFDLHLPKTPDPMVLIHIHGGAWRSGSKSDVRIANLLHHGFAIASVGYRLSTQARFPAQIHDIKAAIRFLRANAKTFKIDTHRLGIVGISAGGHLAALAGVSGKGLEGDLGTHFEQDSSVQCIVSYYGASNLQSILDQSTAFGKEMRVPALQLLLGGLPEEKAGLAKLASPVSHLDKNDPPLLLIHGDADPQMPIQQSQEFAKAYQAMKLPCEFITISGAKHGGPEFHDEKHTTLVVKFLKTHLAPQ